MTTPTETMDWLVAQFRDRADADPEEHTVKDAKEVEAARDVFMDMLNSLKALDERGHTDAVWHIAKRAIAKAEGRTNG